MDLHIIVCGFFIFLQIAVSHATVTVQLQNRTFGPFKDKEGEFGYDYIGTFTGGVYLSKPPDACRNVVPPSPRSMGPNYFLLADDGGCDHFSKLWNAKHAGYNAVIVRNKYSNKLKTMKGDRIGILGLYVSKDTGDILAKYNVSTGAVANIHLEMKFNLEIYLIPLLIIVGICFTIMIMFMGVKYWRTRVHERRNRLSPANLKKIPTKKFREGDEYDLCAICLEDFKVGDKLRVLPCNHAYHCKCVDPWLTNGKKTCPTCKQPVEKDESKEGPSTGLGVDVNERTPLLTTSTTSTTETTQNYTASVELA